MPAELARRPAHPLGYGSYFALVWGKEGENSIRLAEVGAPEYNGFSLVNLGGGHWYPYTVWLILQVALP